MKKLITNADDYGYRPDISKAIVESHLKGVLTSTTVLINFVSSDDVKLAKNTPTLKFGLHLNVTSGEPLTTNWKSKYGEFSRPYRNQPQQFDQEVWIPFFAKYQTADIYQEYEAQLKRFIEVFGQSPTHVDSHHYTSSFDSAFPAFIELAKKYNFPVRRPKIWAKSNDQHPMGNLTSIPEKETQLDSAGIKTTDYFSLKYLNRYETYLEVLKDELSQVKDGQSIEVSFHPGYEEDWRRKDLEILKAPEIKQLINQMELELSTFNML